jgi:hypothetical protein
MNCDICGSTWDGHRDGCPDTLSELGEYLVTLENLSAAELRDECARLWEDLDAARERLAAAQYNRS